MASRPFVVAWRHSAAELGARSRAERDAQLARRWQTLWLLRGGKPMREAAALVGVAYRTAQEWVAWYRAGGLEEVGRHRRGGLRRTIVRPVTPQQEAALARRAATTGFARISKRYAPTSIRCGSTRSSSTPGSMACWTSPQC